MALPAMGTRARARRLRPAIGIVALCLLGCRAPASSERTDNLPPLPPRGRQGAPILVIGIDGAEWSVIRRLWDEGRLPHLRRLAEEGTSSDLRTDYGVSPVVWTTIATGRRPEAHGITDFVVETPRGTVPVSSSLRKVPALWNMASRARLRTGVVGWWASWPAEEITGIAVTDRAHLMDDRIVYPPRYLETFLAERERAESEIPGFDGGRGELDAWMADAATRDRITAHEARRLARRGFDLLLVYFRGVDVASHRYWKEWEPERYPSVSAEDVAEKKGVIPAVYDATDEAIGRILAESPDANVFVVSDHGFVAGPEEHFVNLKADRLLEHLGFLVRDGKSVDFTRSVAYTVQSPNHAREKKLRLSVAGREPGGRVAPGDVGKESRRLAGALAAVTYANRQPVFHVRPARPGEDVDLVAEVRVENPTLEIVAGGETLDDVVLYLNTISGTHNGSTDGIFIARGPDLAPGALADGISIFDVAPTVLYSLGLPVAADFPGEAWTTLFGDGFRERHPLKTIPSWGTMATWKAESSPVDSEIVEALRALGYLGS